MCSESYGHLACSRVEVNLPIILQVIAATQTDKPFTTFRHYFRPSLPPSQGSNQHRIIPFQQPVFMVGTNGSNEEAVVCLRALQPPQKGHDFVLPTHIRKAAAGYGLGFLCGDGAQYRMSAPLEVKIGKAVRTATLVAADTGHNRIRTPTCSQKPSFTIVRMLERPGKGIVPVLRTGHKCRIEVAIGIRTICDHALCTCTFDTHPKTKESAEPWIRERGVSHILVTCLLCQPEKRWRTAIELSAGNHI